jgi:dihydrodipicolinate synthase/N-acetylneuraminate lyase
MSIDSIPAPILQRFRDGGAIPALPLALDAARRLSPRHQRALVRYYVDAGSAGLAVGVHSTQFAIRDPRIGLYKPVLELASETIDDACAGRERKPIKIAGVCGRTPQAIAEASFARSTGYHACLLSLAALGEATAPDLLAHCREVAAILPVVGFYLQESVGGRLLPYDFWRRFVEIPGVLGIKIAPFNRYRTLDVARAVCDAGMERRISLYTGNDDNIVLDLLTPFRFQTPHGPAEARIVGGLLGHWAVWTRQAAALLEHCHAIVREAKPVPPELLARAVEITDANAAFFDAAHGFAGCIPGIHEVLRRQGLMPGIWCLDPAETLSPGQAEAIDRVHAAYPHLNDDAFVQENLDRWLA